MAFTGTVVYFILRNHTNAVVCPTYVRVLWRGKTSPTSTLLLKRPRSLAKFLPPFALAAAAPALMLFLKERGKRMGLRDKERRRIYDPPHPNAQQDSPAVGCPSFFFWVHALLSLSLPLSLLRIGNLLLMASNRRKLS